MYKNDPSKPPKWANFWQIISIFGVIYQPLELNIKNVGHNIQDIGHNIKDVGLNFKGFGQNMKGFHQNMKGFGKNIKDFSQNSNILVKILNI